MAKSQVLSSLKGLSAVVTGGSSGLGLATVERLSRSGCIVAMLDLQEPNELPTNSYFIKADVTNEQDIMNALKIIEEKAKKLDILVNCAGIYVPTVLFDVETQTPACINDFERVLKVSECINATIPKDHQRGVIINTASIAGLEGSVNQCAYAASKSAIVGMTLPLARDLANIGVRVMTIAPGYVMSPIYKQIPQDKMDELGASISFPKRFGHPDEFAHLVQTVIENPILNGEVIRLDGAKRLSPEHAVDINK